MGSPIFKKKNKKKIQQFFFTESDYKHVLKPSCLYFFFFITPWINQFFYSASLSLKFKRFKLILLNWLEL